MTRGRRLVLQYSGGSPCGTSHDKRGSVHDGASYRHYDDDTDDSLGAHSKAKDDDQKKPGKDDDKDQGKDKGKDSDKSVRRKSATISLLCDHDPDTQTTASFVGTDPDECAYFFELRSQHACPSAAPHKPGSVGPGSVFAIILVIAILVYVFGGIFYQRTVAHARGWRQLPNYSLWAGIWGFVSVSSPSQCERRLCFLTVPGCVYYLDIVVCAISAEPQGLPVAIHLAQW